MPKYVKAVREFRGYISNNQEFIPNYADRYHYGEAISTAFYELATGLGWSKMNVQYVIAVGNVILNS